MTKYILFCAQEANFQTRSMLIPYDTSCWSANLKNDINILREYSQSTRVDVDNTLYQINNLLKVCIKWVDGVGFYEPTPYNAAVHSLIHFADGIDLEDVNTEDLQWYRDAFINLCRGFDHVKNYAKLMAMREYLGRPVEIVEGFLVLEQNIKN